MRINLFYDCRDEQGCEQTSGPALQDKHKKSADSGESIKCKLCGWTITAREQKIAIDGSHTHTFFNPAGIVFELACFAKAAGCRLAGQATSEYTWFAGYAWRYALCVRCNSHLGWFYEGCETSFFGLILNNIEQY